ncbi:hypothetical protein [Cohnella sp.]|uniref:hypothetical protein n=1 Tax=Cohnella sp. TaxID=1883426 RepID=UPI00356A94FF
MFWWGDYGKHVDFSHIIIATYDLSATDPFSAHVMLKQTHFAITEISCECLLGDMQAV